MSRIHKLLPLSLSLASALFVGQFSRSAQAGPIPPSPSPINSAGESLLASSTDFIAFSTINVDWEVISTTGTAFAPGLYAYLYQIENNSALEANLDSFEVTLSPSTIGSVVAAGVLFGDDLDLDTPYHPGHNVTNFPILATEQDPFSMHFVGADTTANINIPNYNVTWNISNGNHVDWNTQSDTFYFLSTLPPTYGEASATDSIPPTPFETTADLGGQPVPVPVPEPASALLLGLGSVLALCGVRRLQK